MDKEILSIVGNKLIAQDIFMITLEGDLVSKMTQPGQFLHLKVGKGIDPLLRRPISICDVDLAQQKLTMIYRAEGMGTQLLAQIVPGDEMDVLGPLGQGFPIDQRKKGDKVILVGGGVGVPPLYYLSKELRKREVEVVHVLGFLGKDNVFLEQEFAGLGETHVTTVDGTMGTQGFVTDVLDQWPVQQWDAMYSCGPTPMLKAMADRFEGQPEAYLSLEQRMGCGIGACLACVCHTPESETSYKKVCSDGPVFKVGEVIL